MLQRRCTHSQINKMSRKSVASISTVRTIDDVLSQMDDAIGINATLRQSRDFVKKITKGNQALAAEATSELENIESILSPITSNPKRLVSLMMRHDALVSGPQATSFFYPICEFNSCPWDIFCSLKESERFVDGYKSSSGSDVIEDIRTEDGTRVVHFRRSLNGMEDCCKIRVFIRDRHPLESVLDMKNSYEQSAIMAVGAVCFWPRLQDSSLYRVFVENPGVKDYPKGNSFYESSIRVGKKTSLRKPMEAPSIYSGLEKRTESVIFKNTCNLNPEQYLEKVDALKSIVYCVSNSSTRYLGTTSGMK